MAVNGLMLKRKWWNGKVSMKIIRHTSMIVEKLVILAEYGEPDLVRLLDPNHPEHEGWTLDWHNRFRGHKHKFVLRRHRDYTVLVGSKKLMGVDDV